MISFPGVVFELLPRFFAVSWARRSSLDSFCLRLRTDCLWSVAGRMGGGGVGMVYQGWTEKVMVSRIVENEGVDGENEVVDD